MPHAISGTQSSTSLSPRHPPDLPSYSRATSPAHSSAAESPSASDKAVDTLWGKIQEHRLAIASRTTYFAEDVVAPNFTGLLCPANTQTVKVQMGQNTDSVIALHANYVQLDKCYAVGQSPDGRFEDACMRDLIHSLDSGQGLFQFTSRNAHRVDIGADNPSAHPTIAHMMAQQWKQHSPAMRLGDRYAIENFCVVQNNPPQPNVTRYAITACEIKNGSPDPATRKTVHITQAGLRFVNKLLKQDEIVEAAKLFTTHPPSVMPEGDQADTQTRSQNPPQTGPLICSAAGIGRSAVLAVYQDLSSRLSTDVNRSNLDQKLEEAINNGIDARGPKFLHSCEQLAELRKTLLTLIANTSTARRSSSAEQVARGRFFSPGSDHGIELDAGSIASTPSRRGDTLASQVRNESSSRHRSEHASAQRSEPQSETRSEQHATPSSAQPTTLADLLHQAASPHTQTSDDHAVDTQSSNLSGSAASVRRSTEVPPILKTSTATISYLPGRALVVKAGGNWKTAFKPSAEAARPIDPKSAPINKQIIDTYWPEWGAPSSYGSFKPLNRYADYFEALRAADEMHLQSIAFSSELIATEPPNSNDAPQTEPQPIARAAALAVVAASRYIRKEATTLKAATFQCATDLQKRVYDDLLGRVDQLTQHRVVEALLRPIIRHRSTPTEPEKFFEEGQGATYVPLQINHNADNCADIITPPNAPQGELHGVPFAAWIDAPSTVEEWNAHAEQVAPGFSEPDEPANLSAAGAVIVERDGRVWVVAPTNQFCRLKNTFPKGQIDQPGLTAKGCAVMEAYEESGLQIRLTRHLADSTLGSTRYYLAERIGGTPADVGWESQAVSLVPQSELGKLFDDADGKYDHRRDRLVTNALQKLAP